MIYIITALHCEAKPLIEKFKLKKNPVSPRLDFFENEEIKLIVSGIGKIRSAIATTMLLSQNNSASDSVVVNFGCCGTAHDNHEIGKLLFINKIKDHVNGREMFPDPILRHGLNEASLETFDIPVVKANLHELGSDVVDMEASGFFQAANIFVDTHQIYCLKIVSDFLELSHLSKEFISGLIQKNIDVIEQIFSLLSKFHESEPKLFHENESELLRQVGAVLKLTQTQYHQFVELARSAKLRKRDLIKKLKPFTSSDIKTKSDNKDAFEQLRKTLSL